MSFNTTIIIPTIPGREKLLEEAADSAARQTAGCEILIVKSSKSLSANLNEGLRQARGKYIKVLADDDELLPDSIESLEKAINGWDFVHANAIIFWPTGKIQYYKTGHIPDIATLYRKNRIHGGTVLYRTDVLRAVGGWDESLFTGEELDMHLKLFKNGYKLGFLHKVVYRYRRHQGQKSLGDKRFMEERKKQILEIKRRYR